MKKLIYMLMAVATLAVTFVSCNDFETYAEKRDKERAAITRFIADSTITPISEEQFKNQGYTTNVSKNEYVLFENSGVYMQIVRQGCGSKIADGETVDVICRFREVNVMTDSLLLSNLNYTFASKPEKMTVRNTSGTFTGTFDPSSSVMYEAYSSTAVPSGWLVPLRYINVGRQNEEGQEVAKVKLIVPASEGQTYAAQNVYPCYYEITYQRGR